MTIYNLAIFIAGLSIVFFSSRRGEVCYNVYFVLAALAISLATEAMDCKGHTLLNAVIDSVVAMRFFYTAKKNWHDIIFNVFRGSTVVGLLYFVYLCACGNDTYHTLYAECLEFVNAASLFVFAFFTFWREHFESFIRRVFPPWPTKHFINLLERLEGTISGARWSRGQ